MIEVISVENMRKSDAYTIENFSSGKALMQKAAEGIYDAVQWRGNIAVVCGGGNNGGDGYALALILKTNGKKVAVLALSDKLTSDSSFYYENCKNQGVNIKKFTEDTTFSGYDIIVDCIFGTGFKGDARGIARSAIDEINKSSCYVVSADINSGLNGDNGLGELVVKSNLTVSIGYYKSGHFLNMAKDTMREKTNADIGIKLIDKPFYLLQNTDFQPIFSKRKNFSHKSTYGMSAIIGGSLNYSGAVKLANLSQSALRAGSGLSKLVVPKSIAHSVMPYLLESALISIPDKEGRMIFDKQSIDKALEGVNSLCIGMGWGKSQENKKILEYVLENYEMPVVIDADGINALCNLDLDILKQTRCKIVLTPHLGEFSRLTKKSVEDINSAPIAYVKNFTNEYNTVLLLKGPCTIIADKKNVYLVDRGSPGMATGGSGDVLSGIICGINAFSNQPLILNASCGAFIAGVAGEKAAKENSEYSMIASDTISNISKAVNAIINH